MNRKIKKAFFNTLPRFFYLMFISAILMSIFSCFKKDNNLLPYNEVIDIEDNDNFATANIFSIGENPIVGFFNEKTNSNDADYFRINFKGKVGAFRFTLTGVPGVDSKVTVYDSNKKLLFVMNERKVGESEVAWRYYSTHSELYICIESTFGFNNIVPYIFTIVSEDKDKWVEVEPNNITEEATFIEPGATLKGYIVPASDIDYYKLVFDDYGIKDFRVKVESLSSVNIKLEIMDSTGDRVFVVDNATSGGAEISQRFGSDKGDYTIKISGDITDTSKEPLYYVSVEELPAVVNNKPVYYEREFNNTIDKATSLISGEDMIGTIEKDDIDCFKIDIMSKNDILNISLDGILDRKFHILITDNNQTEYYSADSQNNITIRDLEKGSYYIIISRNLPGSFLYRLFFTTN